MGKSRINKYLASSLTRQEARIEENFRALKLNGILASYQHLAQEALEKNWTSLDLIEHLQHAQINWSDATRVDRWLQYAHFEAIKTLEQFDFSYPTKINQKLIYELASCRFIEKAQNVIFLGQTGVGKTHLAIALGVEAINKGFDTRFLSLRSLNELIDKHSDSLVEQRHLMNTLVRPKLLILDEIALFEPNNLLARFLVELLLNRHLKNSTIFTSNKSIGNWTNAFGDQHTSVMVLDRLIQNVVVVEIEGESYRLKDRLQTQLCKL